MSLVACRSEARRRSTRHDIGPLNTLSLATFGKRIFNVGRGVKKQEKRRRSVGVAVEDDEYRMSMNGLLL